MKLLFSILLFVFITNGSYAQLDFNIHTMGGSDYELSSAAGKKIIITILPATQTSEDSLYLHRLDSISIAEQDKVKVVAVPSFEDGYIEDSLNTLLNWYQSTLNSSITISQPLYTHAASISQQDELFNWLTHSMLNTHFEVEVTGAGMMFFIDEQGNLTGVFGPEARFSDGVLNKMLP